MKQLAKEKERKQSNKAELKPDRVRLPGFIIEQEVGLGDLIERVTHAMGIEPCSGCRKRATALNRWMVFTR